MHGDSAQGQLWAAPFFRMVLTCGPMTASGAGRGFEGVLIGPLAGGAGSGALAALLLVGAALSGGDARPDREEDLHSPGVPAF
jgi:hypothetical protein